MMNSAVASAYLPVLEVKRGETVESLHLGAVAAVDATGRLVASYGDANVVTFLRSSAKPLQALPFIESGGAAAYDLTRREIALMCASHSGTDAHAETARSIQSKAGFSENDLLCGVHTPGDETTAMRLLKCDEVPTPNRHNCSGKHSGMLAFARYLATQSGGEWDRNYIDFNHPIQQRIRNVIAAMCDLPQDQIAMGVDGCSAPNFAIPLRNAALGFARLSDPWAGDVFPPERAAACGTVFDAMTSNPEMVAGPGKFDTRLMEATSGRMISKGGAEGYQCVGIRAGALSPNSPGLGIALKIADGDSRGKARAAVTLEVLRQLGAITDDEFVALAAFGPTFDLFNWRQLLVGKAYPVLELQIGTG